MYTQKQIDRANQADLVFSKLSERLERAGAEYRWKRHDSPTVRENKWYRHSQSKGEVRLMVMEFFGKSFTEAVHHAHRRLRLQAQAGSSVGFRLPPRNPDNRIVRKYFHRPPH